MNCLKALESNQYRQDLRNYNSWEKRQQYEIHIHPRIFPEDCWNSQCRQSDSLQKPPVLSSSDRYWSSLNLKQLGRQGKIIMETRELKKSKPKKSAFNLPLRSLTTAKLCIYKARLQEIQKKTAAGVLTS